MEFFLQKLAIFWGKKSSTWFDERRPPFELPKCSWRPPETGYNCLATFEAIFPCQRAQFWERKIRERERFSPQFASLPPLCLRYAISQNLSWNGKLLQSFLWGGGSNGTVRRNKVSHFQENQRYFSDKKKETTMVEYWTPPEERTWQVRFSYCRIHYFGLKSTKIVQDFHSFVYRPSEVGHSKKMRFSAKDQTKVWPLPTSNHVEVIAPGGYIFAMSQTLSGKVITEAAETLRVRRRPSRRFGCDPNGRVVEWGALDFTIEGSIPADEKSFLLFFSKARIWLTTAKYIQKTR